MIRTTGTIVDGIVANTVRDLQRYPRDEAALERAAATAPPPANALASLKTQGIRIIAEVKRRSPSEGAIATISDPVALAETYARTGAAAISVLTEPHHFGGALEDLRHVSSAVAAPALRKDFIVDPIQILEARANGASMILLIAGLLSETTLRVFRERAEELGMHALVEAHSATEAKTAIDSGARIVGINNRDLRTFEVDLKTCERLRPLLDTVDVAVAESGIANVGHVDRLLSSGYRHFLIGTALVRAPDPGAALKAMLSAEIA